LIGVLDEGGGLALGKGLLILVIDLVCIGRVGCDAKGGEEGESHGVQRLGF